MKKGGTAVFVTAYNEEKVIGDVLSLINGSYDVFLIDDGSDDKTAEIARNHGAEVISHPINLGQGMAVITAFELLAEKDYDIVIEMDGDGQHDPREISKLVDKMQETGADIVAGSRVLGSNYKGAPLARKVFLSPLTWVLNRLTGYKISDSMCGFRGFRGGSLARVRHLFGDMLEPEYIASEMWIKFAKSGLTAVDVPITLSGRRQGYSYKGLYRYAWGVISTTIRSKLDTYKYYKKR
jgi:glycosyltransferase involved in cell wall biosynthesis